MTTPLLSLEQVSRIYRVSHGLFGASRALHAVDGVSLTLAQGDTLGIVGESGSGKSTTGRLALGIEAPDAGRVLVEGAAMPDGRDPAWRALRRRMQMVYQDPLGALDRRLTIAAQIAEPLEIHGVGDRASRAEAVAQALLAVGLSPDQGARYPHELSGGQRQRAVIARALACGPELLVCDEPVSALDVSIQAQVVNLLIGLQESRSLAMLFISHDLRVVRQISRRVAVMYLGRIVEEGPAEVVFRTPQHPYTRALVSAAPAPGKRGPRIVLKGDPPNPAQRPTGCAFHPRCPVAEARCATQAPALLEIAPGRRAACLLVGGAVAQPARAVAAA